jgi:molecular chaperone DnaK (HSP70)
MGIDFGTTNSCMAWYNPKTGQAEELRNAEGQDKTPSLVYFGPQELLVGAHVAFMIDDLRNIIDPTERAEVLRRIIPSIKRQLHTLPLLALPDGQDVRPVDVVAVILRKLKHDAEVMHFHAEVPRVVMTYPAVFDNLLQELLREAAGLAGFREVALIEEPVAAALAYAEAGLRVGNVVLVYDLGGGTFDLALVVREDNGLFRLAMETDGDARCGGDDFDQALYDYWEEQIKQKFDLTVSVSDGVLDLPFLRECRRRKETLSVREQASFRSLIRGKSVPLEIDRATFEGLITHRIEPTVRKTKKMVERAQDAGHTVDTAVLIGGSSELPLVQNWLKKVLPVEPHRTMFKDIAVALGAAYHARTLWLPPPLPASQSIPVPPPTLRYVPPPLRDVPPPLPRDIPPPLPRDVPPPLPRTRQRG